MWCGGGAVVNFGVGVGNCIVLNTKFAAII